MKQMVPMEMLNEITTFSRSLPSSVNHHHLQSITTIFTNLEFITIFHHNVSCSVRHSALIPGLYIGSVLPMQGLEGLMLSALWRFECSSTLSVPGMCV